MIREYFSMAGTEGTTSLVDTQLLGVLPPSLTKSLPSGIYRHGHRREDVSIALRSRHQYQRLIAERVIE